MNRAAWLQDRRMQKFLDVLSRWEAGELSMMEAGEHRAPASQVTISLGDHERATAYQRSDNRAAHAWMEHVGRRRDDRLDVGWL